MGPQSHSQRFSPFQTSSITAASLQVRLVQQYWSSTLACHSRSNSRSSSFCPCCSSICSSGPSKACQDSSMFLNTKEPRALAASPAWFVALMPAAIAPGALGDSEVLRWVMESLICYQGVTFGLPGFLSLAIFLSPMMEVMPRIRRDKDVGRLPLLPYSAMAVTGVIWSAYGLVAGHPAVLSINAISTILGLHYWYVFRQHCPPGADWLPYSMATHQAVLLTTIAASGAAVMLLPYATCASLLGPIADVAVIIMFGGPLAATFTVLKEKSTRSMPFGFTLAINVNCNCWFFYAYFVLDDPFIYMPDAAGILLSTIQLSLFWRFGIYR